MQEGQRKLDIRKVRCGESRDGYAILRLTALRPNAHYYNEFRQEFLDEMHLPEEWRDPELRSCVKSEFPCAVVHFKSKYTARNVIAMLVTLEGE